MKNKRILSAESSDSVIKKLVHSFAQRNEKIHKMCKNDLRAFALRNYSEGYNINKPLSSR